MSACGPRDPGVETLTSSRGSALPFLPTLATAIGIAALSLLCRTPSVETPPVPVATAQAAPVGADGFHPVPVGVETAPAIPATLAFSRLQPLMLHVAETDEPGKPPAARPARSAAAARRACTGSRCSETRRVETAARPAPVKAAVEPAAIPDAMRGRDEPDDDLLPSGTLPFAATAASFVERARKLGGSVGSGAASLGGSVVELLASAR